MHSSAFVALICGLKPMYRLLDFWTAVSGDNWYGFYLNLKLCHLSHAMKILNSIFICIYFVPMFVHHHHFISVMGNMVMQPSHALSRCPSVQQQPSCWKKGFMSGPLPFPHGLLEGPRSPRKHRIWVSMQVQYWLQLPWSVKFMFNLSAVKLSNHWTRTYGETFLS